jgi:tRNA-dihydrouridine synthase
VRVWESGWRFRLRKPRAPEPVLALAPMQDVTDLPFQGLMNRYGGAGDLLRLAKAR